MVCYLRIQPCNICIFIKKINKLTYFLQILYVYILPIRYTYTILNQYKIDSVANTLFFYIYSTLSYQIKLIFNVASED
jgi:hypothetical protein